MPGHDRVIAQGKALIEITLAHPVQIRAQRPALAGRAEQHFRTDAGKHRFQITAINHAVEILIQLLGMAELEQRHGRVGGGQVLAQIRAHAGQSARRVVDEFVEVVDQVGAEQTAPPGVAVEAIFRVRISTELIEQTIRAADVLLEAQTHAIAEMLRRFGVEGFLVVRHRRVDFGGAVQRLQGFLVVDHFAEGLARQAGFFQRQVIALVDHGEPVDVVVDAVVENPARAANGFGRMEITLLLAIDDQFGIALADALDLVPGILLQTPRHIGPVDLLHRGRRRLRRQRFGGRVVGLGRRLAADEIGVKGHAEHRRVAPLPRGAQVDRIGHLEHRAKVDRRVLFDLVVLRLVLVVVAFEFQLQAQPIPRRLVAHATEQ